MTNLQFRTKVDFVGLCRDEKLSEKFHFFRYPTRIEQISKSFDIYYCLNLKLNKQRT